MVQPVCSETVSRRDIDGIWLAFFQERQQSRCGQVVVGSTIEGWLDYSGGASAVDCEMYVGGGTRDYWAAVEPTTVPGAVKRYVLDGDLKYGPDNLPQMVNPNTPVASTPRTNGAACPHYVTKQEASSANPLTTLTAFMATVYYATEAECVGFVQQAFHLPTDVDFFDHAAIYGSDSATVPCDNKRAILKAFLMLDLLVESAVALSPEEGATGARAFREIADLTTDGVIDLTGTDAEVRFLTEIADDFRRFSTICR